MPQVCQEHLGSVDANLVCIDTYGAGRKKTTLTERPKLELTDPGQRGYGIFQASPRRQCDFQDRSFLCI